MSFLSEQHQCDNARPQTLPLCKSHSTSAQTVLKQLIRLKWVNPPDDAACPCALVISPPTPRQRKKAAAISVCFVVTDVVVLCCSLSPPVPPSHPSAAWKQIISPGEECCRNIKRVCREEKRTWKGAKRRNSLSKCDELTLS